MNNIHTDGHTEFTLSLLGPLLHWAYLNQSHWAYLFIVEQGEVNQFGFKWHKGDCIEAQYIFNKVVLWKCGGRLVYTWEENKPRLSDNQ